MGALEQAVIAADPMRVIEDSVRLDGSLLVVKNDSYDLSNVKRIFVIGAGKACAQMAHAMETILGDRITDGFVNVPRGAQIDFRSSRIRFNEALHPLPDASGVAGALRMKELVGNAKKGDLVICLLSGGGSALMPLPRDGVSLSDKVNITEKLLQAGARISEINAVRKHLSSIKGGWLAKSVAGAQVVTLILSDVVGNPLDVIASGPTTPDSATFKDAGDILAKYGLWEEAPQPIRKTLADGKAGLIPETPKPDDEAFSRVKQYVLFDNRRACDAVKEFLSEHGVVASILSTSLEGEARDIGDVLGGKARDLAAKRPDARPSGIVAGGETTVTVHGKGLGGRNQEIVLAASLRIGTTNGLVIASMGTDGVDGPTDAAGAIADGSTLARAREKRMDPSTFLADNNSYNFFSMLGDLILTGPTGTNVSDITVVVAVGETRTMGL